MLRSELAQDNASLGTRSGASNVLDPPRLQVARGSFRKKNPVREKKTFFHKKNIFMENDFFHEKKLFS